jgi:hypothetical protein
MFWNGTSVISLTANSKTKSSPAIWCNMVAWREVPSSMPVSLIYIWDGNQTVRFTDMPGCRIPCLSQGNIAWIGYNDDYDFQVMFASPGTIPSPLLGDLNIDHSVNLLDFSLLAGNWLKTNQ